MSLLMEAIIGFPSRASCKPIQMGLDTTETETHTRAAVTEACIYSRRSCRVGVGGCVISR